MIKAEITEKRENGIVLFEIKEDDFCVGVTNLGCRILSIVTEDRYGKLADVALSYEDVDDCRSDDSCMGAVVGRVANRIGKAEFTLNGETYFLAANNGENHIHGGLEGFDRKLFDYELRKDGVLFRYISEDGEEGYPGALALDVLYRVKDHTIYAEYRAVTDKDTLINITNHTYFNLTGGKDKIYRHKLYIDANEIACVDGNCLPNGVFQKVGGTPFDFREFHEIGERIFEEDEQLRAAGGYDHAYILAGKEKQAVLYEPESGRKLTISTTLPVIQLYTGNFLGGGIRGKEGKIYEDRDGVALETQFLPDSIHLQEEPPVILRKGEIYHSLTTYKFERETV